MNKCIFQQHIHEVSKLSMKLTTVLIVNFIFSSFFFFLVSPSKSSTFWPQQEHCGLKALNRCTNTKIVFYSSRENYFSGVHQKGISNIDDVCLSEELSWQRVWVKWAWLHCPTVGGVEVCQKLKSTNNVWNHQKVPNIMQCWVGCALVGLSVLRYFQKHNTLSIVQ